MISMPPAPRHMPKAGAYSDEDDDDFMIRRRKKHKFL
jgi:hypothetical protein